MNPVNNPTDDGSTRYINTTVYKDVEDKLVKIVGIIGDLLGANGVSRRLRYSEIEVEAERRTGRISADELIISQHVIDTNIRREQSSYVQFYVQSPRAVILQAPDAPETDTTILEKDVTTKLRFPEWQIPMFAVTDGMQQNGYGVMEVVYDESMPGNVRHESVQYGDFGFPEDTRDIQEAEFVLRAMYFSKTALIELCKPALDGKRVPFSSVQVDKIISTAPSNVDANPQLIQTDRTLYKIYKAMFRVNNVVHVAWCCPPTCDGWIRDPQPLFIGRRSAPVPVTQQPVVIPGIVNPQIYTQPQQFTTTEVYETKYPYIIFPYLISENNVIQQLKGRTYLDQDTQQAATSLVSSYCTGNRRASKLLFGVDGDDPNSMLNTSLNSPLMETNINFKDGAIIKQKVKQFVIQPPPDSAINAVNTIMSMNQNETSQVNFAVNNRKDSRKTATEVDAAQQEQNKLSTVQVVLFSNSLRNMYDLMFEVIQSRVNAGLIAVNNPQVKEMYKGRYIVKPAGDVDVIERQQILNMMMNAWPVVQATPLAGEFFLDMMSLMFPQYASKYIQIFKASVMQQQQAQMQQQQGNMQMAQQIGAGIQQLADSPNMFSDEGKLIALPKVQAAAQMIQRMSGTMSQQ